MIYRMTITIFYLNKDDNGKKKLQTDREGGGFHLAEYMDKLGLNSPKGKFSKKGRFWFTEVGWKKFGKDLIAKAESLGFNVRVRKQKNPKKGDVSYIDHYQLVVMPRRGKK